MRKKFPELSGKLVLAPMHDITNIAFRLMAKKYGASLVSTWLISADAIVKKEEKLRLLTKSSRKEKPVSVQIFSNSVESITRAAKILEKNFDVININLGCPSKRIVSQGSGGVLLKEKGKIAEIVRSVSGSVNVPVSVKIRSGYDEKSINALEISKICEENGASAIIIHPRSVVQGYSGRANWRLIREIKENVKIPVIGNGDIFNGKDAERMLKETGCDYVMIGRAAIGNPFVFKQINHYLKTGMLIEQTLGEKIKDYFEYIRLTKKFKIFSIRDAKLGAMEFLKGIPGSSKLRENLNSAKSWKEIKELIEKMKSF